MIRKQQFFIKYSRRASSATRPTKPTGLTGLTELTRLSPDFTLRGSHGLAEPARSHAS